MIDDDDESLDADLLKAAEEIGAKPGEPDSEEQEEEREEGADEAPETSEDRARGPDGKFTKAPAPATAGKPGTGGGSGAASVSAPPPPDTWDQLEKDRYGAIPDPLKPQYLELRSGFEKQYGDVSSVSRLRQDAEAYNQIFAPLDQFLSMNGMSRVDAIRRWAAAHQTLTQNPLEGIKWLAKSYGVDLGALGGPQQQDDAGWLDPMAEKTYGALDQRYAKLESTLQQLLQGQQVQQHNAVDHAIRSFSEAKDQSGALKYPYFSAVRDRMITELRVAHSMGQQMTLEQAYDNAIRVHPEISKTVREKAASDEAAKKEKERKAHLEKARKAQDTRTVSTAPSGKPAKTKGKIKDSVEAAWDELASAA